MRRQAVVRPWLGRVLCADVCTLLNQLIYVDSREIAAVSAYFVPAAVGRQIQWP